VPVSSSSLGGAIVLTQIAYAAMAAVTLDVDAVRARFSALDTSTALFDAPGGTQVPDSVIAAIVDYLRDSNANLGGAFGSSRRTDALLARARLTAAAFLDCEPGETIFGANMTTLNFALTRAAGRTLRAGDEILVTTLDHDGNISPWLELAHDLDLRVHVVGVHDDTTLDLDDLERKLGDRTRVLAFPLASNAVGTLTDAKRIVELAHDAGALAWADAVHYGPHGPIDVGDLGVDVLLCSPYKFFGPHLGLGFVRADLAESWRTYKVRPATHRFETGTLAHELLAGFVACVEYVESIGWEPIRTHERALGQRFLDGLPDRVTLYGLPAMEGRVPTFAFTVAGRSPRSVAETLAERDIAVWEGDYYAVEIMQRLGLGETGAVRAGFVHYNTFAEVDRLLEALEEL
jgi:cysteine desulfurase family protein (TIGR01976 family)